MAVRLSPRLSDESSNRPEIAGYELLELLGAGHSGRVYRARREGDDAIVAIKIAHPAKRYSHEHVAFNLEYSLHANLRHPGIVRAHHSGDCGDGRRFYTMDYVPSISLSEVYRRGGLGTLGEVALRVCDALEFTHAQGILHADLKPANILVTLDSSHRVESVGIGDFGLAQLLRNPSRRDVHGSLAYLAPEQFLGWRIDARSDLYSLGISIVEAITGELPAFQNGAGLASSLPGVPPRSILDEVPDLEVGWATLLDAMTALAPGDRPSSASDVVDRLAALLGRRAENDTFDRRASAPILELAPGLRVIGRAALLETLDAARRASHGPRAVFLHGDEGVGKTRAVEEFLQRIELDGGRVVRADMNEPGGGAAFVTARARAKAAATRAAEIDQVAASLFGENSGARRDTLLVIDSLEVADAESLAIVRDLIPRLEGKSAFFIAIARDGEGDEARTFLRGADVVEVAVEPLGREPARELLLSILSDTGAGDARHLPLDHETANDLVEWMSEHYGGNPRRLLGGMRELVRRGVLRRDPEGWQLDRRLLRDEPPSAPGEDLLVARLAELDSSERVILETAAALGVEFEAPLVAEIHGEREAELHEVLARAIRLGLLQHGQSGATSYRFATTALARAVLSDLEPGRLADLHARIARLLESDPANPAHPAVLAPHLEAAGDRPRAGNLLVDAASAARSIGAHPEATRNYARAWQLLPDSVRETIPAFVLEWVHSLHACGYFLQASECAEIALAAASDEAKSGERGTRLAVLWGSCLAAQGRSKEALTILSAFLDEDRPLGDPALEALASAEYARVLYLANRREEARARLLRARDFAVAHGDRRLAGVAEMRLGYLSWLEHDTTSAIDCHRRAEAHLACPEGAFYLPVVLGQLASCHLARLELEESIRAHRESAKEFGQQYRSLEAAREYQNLATVYLEMGRWNEAEEALESSNRWGRTIRGSRELSHYCWGTARLAYWRGLLPEAATRAAQSLEQALAHSDPIVIVNARTLVAFVDAARGRSEEVRKAATEALGEARASDYSWGIAKSLALLALAEPEASETRAAQLDQALKRADSADREKIFLLVFHIELARAECFGSRGRPAEAAQCLERCRELQSRCGSILWEGLIRFVEGKNRLCEGHAAAACDALSRAQDIFTELGAEKFRADVYAKLAVGLHALGNHHGADASWRQSAAILETLRLPVPPSPLPAAGSSGSSLDVMRASIEAATTLLDSLVEPEAHERLLEDLLDLAMSHLGAQRGIIALEDPATGALLVKCARFMSSDAMPDSLEVSRTALERFEGGDGVLVTGDALSDPALGVHESIRKLRIRSLIAVPIRQGAERIGVLYMDHRDVVDLFREEQQLFLEMLARFAAISLHVGRRLATEREGARVLRHELEETDPGIPGVIAHSPAMLQVIDMLRRAALHARIVLLRGPTGSGKDHLAQALHRISGRKGRFVHAAILSHQETLLRGDFFGVKGGSATGVNSRLGLFEEARGGTIFLNEIGDASMDAQNALLESLDQLEYMPVGEGKVIHKVDALIILATNVDLERRIEEGAFRADFLYRIADHVIYVPPLSERLEDIPLLVEHFFDQLSGGRVIPSPEAMRVLAEHPWNGNVRELSNCVRSSISYAVNGVVEAKDLLSAGKKLLDEARAAAAETESSAERLRRLEIQLIRQALIKCGGIITHAARDLGMNETNLRRKIDAYELRHLVTMRKRRDELG